MDKGSGLVYLKVRGGELRRPSALASVVTLPLTPTTVLKVVVFLLDYQTTFVIDHSLRSSGPDLIIPVDPLSTCSRP